MHRVLCLALVIGFLGAVSGCAPEPEKPESIGDTRWVNVYYAAAEAGKRHNVLAPEQCEIAQGTLEETVRAIFEESQKDPVSNSLKAAVPQDATLSSVKIENGSATLDISREYGNITGFVRTVADYCLTMSLCELEGIRDVTILVNGVPPYGRNAEKMTPDDVVLAELELVGYQKSLKLYFPDSDYTTLKLELRNTVAREEEEEALLVVKALLDGPAGRGMKSAIPRGTEILSVRTIKGVCSVDFSSLFITGRPQGEKQEQLVIRALVDSLTELSEIKQVQILIDGAKIKGFTYFDLSQPFSRGYI